MRKTSNNWKELNIDLLDAFNNRKESAFCYVYEHFYNELFYFASKLFANTTTSAYDILQDLFLKIWESDKQFPSFDFLKSYLYLSIRNRHKNSLAHDESVQKYIKENQEELEDNYILSHIIEAETLAILFNHLKLLPPGCAQIIKLTLEGHKSPEIAKLLNISINTVYAQKQKALTILRGHLSKEMLGILLYIILR